MYYIIKFFLAILCGIDEDAFFMDAPAPAPALDPAEKLSLPLNQKVLIVLVILGVRALIGYCF